MTVEASALIDDDIDAIVGRKKIETQPRRPGKFRWRLDRNAWPVLAVAALCWVLSCAVYSPSKQDVRDYKSFGEGFIGVSLYEMLGKADGTMTLHVDLVNKGRRAQPVFMALRPNLPWVIFSDATVVAAVPTQPVRVTFDPRLIRIRLVEPLKAGGSAQIVVSGIDIKARQYYSAATRAVSLDVLAGSDRPQHQESHVVLPWTKGRASTAGDR